MFEKVCAVLAEQLNLKAEAIKATDRINEDLNADSIDVVSMLMELEESYGITIPEEDYDKIKTVQDIVDEMEKLQK